MQDNKSQTLNACWDLVNHADTPEKINTAARELMRSRLSNDEFEYFMNALIYKSRRLYL